ncbi:uncharacterized protein PHACADRAFT_185571 [Phanerochaete carnosa HHB-10118-sp]|uniref:FAD-binding domain-containing protein n=1 Tax=Phanerochaete carnosa (strain HHB-10118-sp) TaxID=650164 RepID=K5W695_PHACS|nr:uncharacterized protein PHACADRAFT_185571 [Phanerochaete carnosa HHB-10118-sp]EKM54680.1 hypothetical protein PHACADRAFT_185571 [Phanerochaete carnosa HHB-10118-sp]
MKQPLRVAICGGGIGGLFLALVLKKYAGSKTLLLHVYEAGPHFTETGAGISIWDRTRSMMKTLGLDEALAKQAVQMPSLTFRKSDTEDPVEWYKFFNPDARAIPRTEMLNFLVDNLYLENTSFLTTHFSKRLTLYEQDADDGSVAQADILIGADGVGSATRKKMYSDLADRARPTGPKRAEELTELISPSWTGTYAYRTLLKSEKVVDKSPNNPILRGGITRTLMVSPVVRQRQGIVVQSLHLVRVDRSRAQHVVTYPISPTVINVIFFETVIGGLGQPLTGPTTSIASREEVINLYKGWEPDLCAFTELLFPVSDRRSQDRRRDFEVGHQSSPWLAALRRRARCPPGGLCTFEHQLPSSPTADLSYEAHAMSTHLGAGAGQAMEDAYVLGRLLAHPATDVSNVTDALRIYDAVRRPVASEVVERSLKAGLLYEFVAEAFPPGADAAKVHAGDPDELQKVAEEVMDMWVRQNASTPEEDWLKVQEMLRTA